jgi:hypothetical protein
MPNWEYKIITSGALGFATLQLLEQNLNLLGKEEWEIIHYQTRPDNPLAFTGLAKRPVMRDWVVEGAPAIGMPATKSGAVPVQPEEHQASAPSVKELRAEAEERRDSLLAREESLRPLHGAGDDDTGDEFDESGDDEDLPTFFEAIRPHMRKNVRGPGMAVGIEYLAKKFEQTEADLLEALKECGFTIPANAKDQPAYLEYDGDLYWLNLNHRGQLWINTREKPRAVFRPAQGQQVAIGELPGESPAGAAPPKPEGRAEDERSDPATEPAGVRQPPEAGAAKEPLPTGPALLDRLRPVMRRNRRGAGLSGSFSYLTRALQVEPKTLEGALGALGLELPQRPNDKPRFVEIGDFVYWLNQDKSGQIWINTRERRTDEEPKAGVPAAPQTELPLEQPAPVAADTPAPVSPTAPATGSPLAAVRLLLKETRRGGVAAEVGRLAGQLGKSTEDFLAALVDAGLRVPEKAREKPAFAEHAGEIFWLNRNARGELWLNAKAAKFAEKPEEGKPTAEAPEKAGAPAAKRSRAPRRRR